MAEKEVIQFDDMTFPFPLLATFSESEDLDWRYAVMCNEKNISLVKDYYKDDREPEVLIERKWKIVAGQTVGIERFNDEIRVKVDKKVVIRY